MEAHTVDKNAIQFVKPANQDNYLLAKIPGETNRQLLPAELKKLEIEHVIVKPEYRDNFIMVSSSAEKRLTLAGFPDIIKMPEGHKEFSVYIEALLMGVNKAQAQASDNRPAIKTAYR